MNEKDINEIANILESEDEEYDLTKDNLEEDIEEEDEEDFDISASLMSPKEIAMHLNTRAKGKGSDSMKALQEIMAIQLGKDRLGNKIEIKFMSGKEISVEEWNTKVEDYLNWEMAEVVVLEENIENNPLLSKKEKDVLLSINKQALMSLVSIFRNTTHTRNNNNELTEV